MKSKTYILSSRLDPETTITRIGDLLAKRGVQYRAEGFSIFSISTPITLLSFQRALYSDTNWVGLNPFAFISGVNVRCHAGNRGLTEIIVQVNKARTFLWVAFWILSSALAASVMPQPEGVILFIAVTLAAWFGLMSFLGGYLIKKEIMACFGAEKASHG